MVKIPELAEDGQNWKIYRVKFLEVTAIFDCLKVLAGRPYKGEDWDGCNALPCCMFMETVAPSIYFKIRHRTAHENFKYLMKCFRNNNPIPRANELQCAGTATVAEMPENYPTSANAATEQHAHANSDEEDLTTTKALTQGTQDVDDGNVGCTQDPCTSTEAPVEGISAECTEMTSVILKSAPHETQNQLETSLPLTPRLPTDGEPSRCKQEVAESVMMAERANRTVEKAEPTEIVDVDLERAVLGGDLVERACGVDEGDGMERKGKLQLQETKLLCREIIQHSGNTTGDVPSARKLPLVGEWTVCASGKASDLEVEPTDVPIELETLVIVLIQLEDLCSGEIPCVHLRGTNWCACNAEGFGS